MENKSERVKITCENERCQVGHMDVPASNNKKGFLFSPRIVWSGFSPITEDYRLDRRMQGDGQLLRCPRCKGMLCVEGNTKLRVAETDEVVDARNRARERIVAQVKMDGDVHMHVHGRRMDSGLVPIILGKTRIIVER